MAQFHELASIFEIDDDGEEHRARRILDEVCLTSFVDYFCVILEKPQYRLCP